MPSFDELSRARRAALPPTGADLLRAFLRLPAHQARAILQTAAEEAAPLEGGMVGVLLSAALRRARDLDSGGSRLALPQTADGDDDAHGVLIRVALARVRTAGQAEDHPTPPRINKDSDRGPRAAPPPPGETVLRAFLRLPARQARALLPTPAGDEALEGGILGALLAAALRRVRDLDAGDVHLPFPLRADDDDAALGVLLRVALARVRAAGRIEAPISSEQELDWLLFNALLHRARRVDPPPSDVYLLRLLLRVPARQARRLLPPPPAERTRTRGGPRSAHPGPTLVPFMLYAGLRRLQATIPPGSDGLLRDFVQVLRPLSLALRPAPTHGDHAVVLLPPPPPAPTVHRSGILSAALALVERAPPERPLRDDEEDDDVVVLILRLVLPRIHTGGPVQF